jgi:hypothetical protein
MTYERKLFEVVRSVLCSPQECDDEHENECSCRKVAKAVCKSIQTDAQTGARR